MRILKQSTATTRMVFMAASSDHVTGKTGLTLTITASKAGAAFASISPTVTERGSGWYSVALTASHTDTLGDLALHVTGTDADPSDLLMQVVAVNVEDAVRFGLTALPNAAADAAGGLPISDAGGLDLDGRLDTNVGSRLASAGYTAPPTAAAIADAVHDEPLAGHLTDGTAGKALQLARAGGIWRREVGTDEFLIYDIDGTTLLATLPLTPSGGPFTSSV